MASKGVTTRKEDQCAHYHDGYNPLPQQAPGAGAAVGHTVENSIPLSIFPIATDKFVFAMCGLPGRGKTHISRRIARYLSFFHAIPVRVFNVTEYRLKHCGAIKDSDWFDNSNAEAQKVRDDVNELIIADIIKYLGEHSNGVALLDSTNPTHTRRVNLMNKLRISGAKIMFIEVTNSLDRLTDQSAITASLKDMPDYANMDISSAEVDYRKRLATYKTFFEPLDTANHNVEGKWSYFKCDHERQNFVVNKVGGYLPLKVIHFIMNLRTCNKSYFLSRHGQSEYNEVGRIGGDSGLSTHGLAYARTLANFVRDDIIKNECGEAIPARLWTSTLRRTKETAQFIEHPKLVLKDEDGNDYEWVQLRPRAWHHLDELFAGSCDGMTYEEIEEQFPEEFKRRNTDKLAYRYPRGESYLDVIARLEPIIIEMERHKEPLLIIAHQGILRIIYAFYMGLTRAEAPYVSVPLNCVLELTPSAFSCEVKTHVLYTPEKDLPHDGQTEFNPNAPSH